MLLTLSISDRVVDGTNACNKSNLEYQFLSNHWSQAMLSLVSTWMGDCSSVVWVLLLTLICRLYMNHSPIPVVVLMQLGSFGTLTDARRSLWSKQPSEPGLLKMPSWVGNQSRSPYVTLHGSAGWNKKNLEEMWISCRSSTHILYGDRMPKEFVQSWCCIRVCYCAACMLHCWFFPFLSERELWSNSRQSKPCTSTLYYVLGR